MASRARWTAASPGGSGCEAGTGGDWPRVARGAVRRRRRGGATQLVPAAGVDDQEAATGVFEDIDGMKIRGVADQKIRIASDEARALRPQFMASDFVEIEARRNELAGKAEGRGLQPREAARCARPEVGHHRHEPRRGARVAGEHIVRFAPHAAIRRRGKVRRPDRRRGAERKCPRGAARPRVSRRAPRDCPCRR